ncbi:probable disease resistance protein At1g61300 [Rutidosis leptorrhynchoides]|uniref:probable disease resistance protein At1g61300 n=1 Tax=Rutidosis leptorrhynchoides TaxID=125765 RepID=UPI003A9A1F15
MADQIVSVLGEVAELLVEPTKRQLRYIFRYKRILEELREAIRKLKGTQGQVQKDVEVAKGNAEKIRDDVEDWLKKVQTAVEGMESLENDLQQLSSSCCNANWFSRYMSCRKAAKEVIEATKLAENGHLAKVGDPAPLPFIPFKGFVSSDTTKAAFEQVLEELKDDKVSVIGLYGMGGVGKTTLAKSLREKVEELKLFDTVVWATVSQFDTKSIQEQIAEELRLKFDESNVMKRASRLMVRLQSERNTLLILDDVWKPLDFTEIGIPQVHDNNGCKIMLTTRKKDVCTSMGCQKMVQLSVLTEDEAWALFKVTAGISEDRESSTFIDVAKEAAKECQGLPLAIVIVGKTLKGKSASEWSSALDKLRNARFVNVHDGEDIYPRIKVSFDFLNGKKIQSCFLLCSLFPEDYEIPIEDLTWIAWGLGLFEYYTTMGTARREMIVMMDTLRNCGLVLDAEAGDRFVKLHDIVRDTAHWIASDGENIFMVKHNAELESWPKDNRSECYTAISLMHNSIEEIPQGLAYPKLNTLFMQGVRKVCGSCFREMNALKVLRMSHCQLFQVSFQFLTNLQTLELNKCNFMMDDFSSIKNLSSLEILRIRDVGVSEFPYEIFELKNLKVLQLMELSSLRSISPQAISRLSNLKEFCALDCPNFLENGRFEDHDGRFEEQGKAFLTELSKLPRLKGLVLEIHEKHIAATGLIFHTLSTFNISVTSGYLEDFSQIIDTRTLRLERGNARLFSPFINLLPSVENLHLDYCDGFQNIIPDVHKGGDMKDLRNLDIIRCPDVECVFDLAHVEDSLGITFSNLTDLYLEDLDKLKCIWNGPSQHFRHQSLRNVYIEDCPNLEYVFPVHIGSSLLHLEKLSITNCAALKHVFAAYGSDGNADMIIELPKLKIIELSRMLQENFNFYSRRYHFIFPILDRIIVRELPHMTMSFSIDTNAAVHAKARAEGEMSTQAITSTSSNGFVWARGDTESTLPPYVEADD